MGEGGEEGKEECQIDVVLWDRTAGRCRVGSSRRGRLSEEEEFSLADYAGDIGGSDDGC